MPVPEQMRHYDECSLCYSFQYSDILVVNKRGACCPVVLNFANSFAGKMQVGHSRQQKSSQQKEVM
jgi:hypothetical protein